MRFDVHVVPEHALRDSIQMKRFRTPSALSAALTATAVIFTVAAVAGGLLYLDRKQDRPIVVAAAASASPDQLATAAEIRHILADRIDVQRQSVGIVVGTIGPHGRSIIAHGDFGGLDPRPVDGDTIFEIGSVTKVFTGLLLADMAARGEVALNDPVAEYLPMNVALPERGGKAITLVDLATQTSGLPRMPDNIGPTDETNPYADYTIDEMYAFVSGYELPRDIGAEYEYSNLGSALLGQALAHRAGKSYEALVQERIVGPLAMRSTAIELAPRLGKRMATGHNETLEIVPNWDLPAFAGAGALRSSANDLLELLQVTVNKNRTPLTTALAATLATRRAIGEQETSAALGWFITQSSNGEIAWHDGGTGGYSAFIGFHPASRTGVVVLSNANTGVSDIGLHLLNREIPLTRAKPRHSEVATDASLFDTYTGRYQLAPDVVLTVLREDDALYAQFSGQPKMQLFAEGGHRFFYKEVEAAITFAAPASNRSPSLVLHRFGRDMPAARLSD
ncbi:CubicO group peptidase (beta-lactamase class C family) [Aminobacter aminovorans]|uniref:D-alanyl-D-alanine-carboxypeptidase/endopeptidase AmpH n=2 Tax=Aminobacter aminovorans TaxID=83263 RepID=A0A380WGU9_AMIAI|nr:CubicO group peptidase (beta-lactamase class C family) [Aminobacter aminovorans]SUU88111.1 D-alanyl-D-alanine-carboxypeptidase/endopeptidaseAmpH precursor [Aminobacter aminovorans]